MCAIFVPLWCCKHSPLLSRKICNGCLSEAVSLCVCVCLHYSVNSDVCNLSDVVRSRESSSVCTVNKGRERGGKDRLVIGGEEDCLYDIISSTTNLKQTPTEFTGLYLLRFKFQTEPVSRQINTYSLLDKYIVNRLAPTTIQIYHFKTKPNFIYNCAG